MRQWERGKLRSRDQNDGERGKDRSKGRGRKDDRDDRVEDEKVQARRPINNKVFSYFI